MYVRVRDGVMKMEGMREYGWTLRRRGLTPSLENPIQERSAFFGNGTIPS
jgi:hypothetical protein